MSNIEWTDETWNPCVGLHAGFGGLGSKGGDWDLWPEELDDLKRREFPGAEEGAGA